MSDIPLPGGGTLKLYDSIYTPQQIEAAIGKGPMIQNGTWWLWDVATMKYWDTGYSLAEGLGPGAVTTPMLADGSVTTTKMADGAVDWSKIAPEARRINDNLLGNAYFIGGGSQQGGGQFPINQRGLTEYTTNGYTIDRWKIEGDGGTLTIHPDGIVMTCTGSWFRMVQLFENYESFAGKTVTFSTLMDDDLLSATFIFGNGDGSGKLIAPNIRVFSIDQNLPFAVQLMSAGSTGKIKAFKLELGPISTLAHESAGGVDPE